MPWEPVRRETSEVSHTCTPTYRTLHAVSYRRPETGPAIALHPWYKIISTYVCTMFSVIVCVAGS